MQHSDTIIIRKIIKEIDFDVERLKCVSSEEFMTDEDAQHAVGMAVINVGELIRHVSEELRASAPNIPWNRPPGSGTLRRIHTIRMDDLYKTIEEDFPHLRDQLKELQNVDKR